MGLTCVGFIFLAVVLTSSLISRRRFESSQREQVQALPASTIAEAGSPSVHPCDFGAAFIADGDCFVYTFWALKSLNFAEFNVFRFNGLR